jgi:NAD(P)H-dependent FMN reductase
MIIIASTRPGRKGKPIGTWVHERALADGRFEVEVADLAELNLPLMDEPNHPSQKNYQHDHTKAWSARVEASDAFVFVTPEYNHSYNAPLKNAIDYLSQEWAHKPAAFVSYGGVAGGARAVLGLRPVLAVLKMVPITDGVTMVGFTQYFDQEGKFNPTDRLNDNADGMFPTLERWVGALATLRS